MGHQGGKKGIFFEKILFSEIIRGIELILCIHNIDFSLYINCVLFRSDENSGCYGSVTFPLTNNGKIGNCNFLFCYCRCFYKSFTEMFLE